MDPRMSHQSALLDDASSTLAQLQRSLAQSGVAVPSLDALARIALSLLDRPGDAVLGQICRRDGAESAFCLALETHRLQEGARGSLRQAGAGWPQVLAEGVKVALRASQSLQFGVSTPFAPYWPLELQDLGDAAPLALWTAGDASLLTSDGKVTIIGGRTGSVYGRGRAVELAAELARRGHVIVTPASTGTDLDVVSAALAAGGRVIALTAGGLDRPDAASAEALRAIVDAGGAIATEVPPTARTTQPRLLARCRLLAAVSPQLLVLEAGIHSPAVAAARMAGDLGRDVAALSGANGAWSAGSQLLVDELTARRVSGAGALLQR